MITLINIQSYKMTSWEEYSAGTHTVLRVYLENDGQYMSLNEDNTLSMVDRQDATLFYLNQHVSVANMRVSYEILPNMDAKYDELYKSYGDIKKGNQSFLKSDNSNETYTLHFKEHLNKDVVVESISIYVNVDGNYWSLDNYGDGRVVWWNMEKNADTGSLTPKPNQKFKLIFA